MVSLCELSLGESWQWGNCRLTERHSSDEREAAPRLDARGEKSQKWDTKDHTLPAVARGQLEVRSLEPHHFHEWLEWLGKKSILLRDAEKKENQRKTVNGGCCWWEKRFSAELCTHSTPRKSSLITEPHELIIDLWYGFDSWKCDRFFLIINSIINEKSTVDMMPQPYHHSWQSEASSRTPNLTLQKGSGQRAKAC